MTNILQDTKSRISSNTVICKQPHEAVPCQGRNYSDAVKPTSVSDDYQMRTKGCVSSPTADVVQHQQEQLPPQLPPQLPTKLLTSTTTEKPLHPRAQIRPKSQNDKKDTETAGKTSLANQNCRTIESDTQPNSTSATVRPITKSTSYKLFPWISADDPDCEDPNVKALRKMVSDRKPSHPKSVLFVGNLPSEIDEDRLPNLFRKELPARELLILSTCTAAV